MDYYAESDANKEHADFQVFDCHVHVRDFENSIKHRDIIQQAKLKGLCFQSLTRMKEEFTHHNVLCLLLKKMLGEGIYAFGGIYRPLPGNKMCDKDYLLQIKRLMEIGFDGLKMIDAKPPVRKELNIPLDSSEFDLMYDYLENNAIPIMNHVGDPKNFWDIKNAPPIAVQNGWTYTDGTYIKPETYYEEIENILKKFPKLKFIFAHFFFLSEQIDRAEEFMEKYPNISFDITPGTEMYNNFSKEPDQWHDFFTRYNKRILFGTDNGYFGETIYDINAVRTFLETGKSFNAWGTPIKGIELDGCSLENIYYHNFMNCVNHCEPIKINADLVLDECEYLHKRAEKSPVRDLLNQLISEVQQKLKMLNE